jgi:hypothetical protein
MANLTPCPGVDERRKRVIGIMAAILASLQKRTGDDLLGDPQDETTASDGLDLGVPHRSRWGSLDFGAGDFERADRLFLSLLFWVGLSAARFSRYFNSQLRFQFLDRIQTH